MNLGAYPPTADIADVHLSTIYPTAIPTCSQSEPLHEPSEDGEMLPRSQEEGRDNIGAFYEHQLHVLRLFSLSLIIFILMGSFVMAFSLWYSSINISMAFLDLLRGLLNWIPLLLAREIFLRKPKNYTSSKYSLLTIGGTLLFGLLCWANHSVSLLDGFYSWSVTNLPDSFHQCQARVSAQQSALFNPGYIDWSKHSIDPGIYHAQFDRISVESEDTFTLARINTTLFQEIFYDQILCNSGFRGNSDYYGIGIRIGLYLQWMALLLGNTFLPNVQKELKTIYLVFSVAICCATVITTFVRSCTFSIEIQILYWMYLGGYVCVFGTSPEKIELGFHVQWVQLD